MSESKGQVEQLLQELGKKIDQLMEEAREAKDELRDEFEEKIEELKERKEKLESEFEDFKSQEKWQEAKVHFVSAVDELRKAVKAVFQKD